jgi:hypothetical protein
VDGWTNLQKQLDSHYFIASRAFTITFIMLASFIFLNMFVGVMIMHTEVRLRLQGHVWGWVRSDMTGAGMGEASCVSLLKCSGGG